MTPLDPIDASILVVMADLPEGDPSADDLFARLETAEARLIGRVLTAKDEDAVDVPERAKKTARALKRRPVAAAAR